MRNAGAALIRDEARALDALADSLGPMFDEACARIAACGGKLIVAGLGKSGHIARKIAATFASTGTAALFLHLAEAIHGDLGMASPGDVALIVSQSGQTAELADVLDHLDRVGIAVIGITGHAQSLLGQRAAVPLLLPAWPEVGPEAVAPTTSTTMTLALGDALAMCVMQQKGFGRGDFARLHPGGTLGARLRAVTSRMRTGEAMPLVRSTASMHEAVVEISAKRLGMVGVLDAGGRLAGVITDGDLRRHVELGLDHPAERFMTRDPKTLGPDALVDEAIDLFEEYRITALFVVDPEGRPLGALHIHDTPAAR